MESVRLQVRDIYELQDYIDAQSGGPGKGFFRIVTSPFQARRVIADGKLAVVLGIEVSELFNCSHRDYQPNCTKEDIDRQLDEVYKLGVRDLELTSFVRPDRVPACDGFYGASSMERLPTEVAITDQVRRFSALRRK